MICFPISLFTKPRGFLTCWELFLLVFLFTSLDRAEEIKIVRAEWIGEAESHFHRLLLSGLGRLRVILSVLAFGGLSCETLQLDQVEKTQGEVILDLKLWELNELGSSQTSSFWSWKAESHFIGSCVRGPFLRNSPSRDQVEKTQGEVL